MYWPLSSSTAVLAAKSMNNCRKLSAKARPAFAEILLNRVAASTVRGVSAMISGKVAFNCSLSSIESPSTSSVRSRADSRAAAVHGNALPQFRQYAGAVSSFSPLNASSPNRPRILAWQDSQYMIVFAPHFVQCEVLCAGYLVALSFTMWPLKQICAVSYSPMWSRLSYQPGRSSRRPRTQQLPPRRLPMPPEPNSSTFRDSPPKKSAKCENVSPFRRPGVELAACRALLGTGTCLHGEAAKP